MKKLYKKVMVFGVFDRLHEGHDAFLKQARSYGDELIAVVARDTAVRELKEKTPHQSEKERINALKENNFVAKAILGDAVQGSYEVLSASMPDMLCLGYDQDGLLSDLQKRMAQGLIRKIPVVQLKAHKPYTLHTSLL